MSTAGRRSKGRGVRWTATGFGLALAAVGCAPTGPDDSVAGTPGGPAGRGVAAVPPEGVDVPALPVDPEAPPVAVARTCGAAVAFERCVLDGTASGSPAGKPIVSWSWEVPGAGRPPPGARVDYAFDAPGSFQVELEVTDAAGRTGRATAAVEVSPGPPRSWLVLLSMNGDNDLEGAALGDLDEMERVGSTDDVLVLAQLDRTEGYAEEDGAFSGARRYAVAHDLDAGRVTSPVLDDLGEVDMGAPESLVDLAAWAAARVEADRWFFVIWDHGDGWTAAAAPGGGRPGERLTRGISRDDTSGSVLSVAEGELALALAGVAAARGGPVDLLGFDACVMQMWEVAREAAPYALHQVASEDYEGWDGWWYDAWLADLSSRADLGPVELGDRVAATLIESGDATLSVLDLAAVDALTLALDGLAGAVLDGPPGSVDGLREVARDARAYDWSTVDLADLADRAAAAEDPAIADAAAALAASARAAVRAEHHAPWVDGSNGVAVYLPLWGTADPAYGAAPWAGATRWDDLVGAMGAE